MRWVAWACVVVCSSAAAQPGDSDAEFQACKARRRELTRAAMKVDDVQERGRMLARMPICRRLDDPANDVSAPVPVAEPRRPWAPRGELGLVLGGASWAFATHVLGPPTGTSPFFELEAGASARDRLSVVGFVGYSELHTRFLYDVFMHSAIYSGDEQLTDVGAKVRLHHGRLAFGGGLGVEHEHATGSSMLTGPRDYRNTYALVEADVSYRVATIDHLAFRLAAITSVATSTSDDAPGNIVSARLALAVSWHSNELVVGGH